MTELDEHLEHSGRHQGLGGGWRVRGAGQDGHVSRRLTSKKRDRLHGCPQGPTSLRPLLGRFPRSLHKNCELLYQGCLEILEAS